MDLSPWDPWVPYKEGGNFSSVRFYSLDIDEIINLYEETDPISTKLYFACLNTLVSNSPLQVTTNSDDSKEVKIRKNLRSLKSNRCNMLATKEIRKMWGIGLNTARRTLTDTTDQCIWSTGLISQCFCTYNNQFQYKQLTRKYGRFYTYYIKVVFNLVRKFIGGNIYLKNLGYTSSSLASMIPPIKQGTRFGTSLS